MRASVGRG
jgi:hypothetical protein